MVKKHNQVVLTGFMGMGKSTVAPLVAEQLGVRTYDTDDWMETQMGIDVPALVSTDMTEFRRQEARALQHILDQEPGVISTGGGIVSTDIGRSALARSVAPIMWLRAPFEVASERVSQDQGRERPLFNDVDNARVLFDDRQKWYEMTADFQVNASLPAEVVAQCIVTAIR